MELTEQDNYFLDRLKGQKLTLEQRDLLNKLAKTMNEQPPVKKRGIFG